MEVLQRLRELADPEYREFQCRLMPTVDKSKVLGIRMPQLRAFAKEFAKTDPEGAKEFLSSLPHAYYDENNLHACLIESVRDFDSALAAVDEFLPYVDNWATCDMMSPKTFRKHPIELLVHVRRWMKSERTYTVRFGIGMLMKFYLDGEFREEFPKAVAEIKSDEYYVNMMIAWYFATALAKQYEAVIPYIEERRLSPWVHGKTIQKAIESYRITPEQKEYLKTLK